MTKTARTAKTTKAAAKASKTRLPAAVQMANRTRVSFGAAFIRDASAGVQRDIVKLMAFAAAAGIVSLSKAQRMKDETLVAKVAEALQTIDPDTLPKNASLVA